MNQEHIQTFAANAAHAARNHQTVKVGGGDFSPQELASVAAALKNYESMVNTLAEATAAAWAEGYKAGIADERTSEANIGIAGYNAKVEPARQNPYGSSAAAQGAEDVLVNREVNRG